MPGMDIMIQGYKDLIVERDKKIIEMTNTVNDEYEHKLADYKKELHKELDKQVRGLS